MGPASQLCVFNQRGAAAEVALLGGWLKGETTAGNYWYSSPLVTATTKGGNVLLHTTADGAEVFVEHGVASVSGGSAPVVSSPEKIFFTRKTGKPVVAAERPSRDFIAGMPICFRDVLPPRLSAFEGKKPPMPKTDHDVSYTEIHRWLTISPAWRRAFPAR